MLKFDDQINRKHQRIDKLMEGYSSLAIRTTVLGQDKYMSEYWFFKDDPHRLYVKKIATKEDLVVDSIDEIDDKQKYIWHFIDEEDQFEQLFDSLNMKGIREKKLIENLKKIRTILKMKKSKKANKPVEEGAEEEAKEK